MIRHPEIWNIILTHMPRGRVVLLEEIYRMIERHGNLDSEDFEPQSPSSGLPKWRRNTRNVLKYRTGKGEIQWHARARYLLP